MVKRRRSKGFTLMEMVVVIAIIAILAVIAAPQALRAINRSRASADIASAKNIATSVMQAMAEGYEGEDGWIEVGSENKDPILKKYKIEPIPKVKANKDYKFFFKAKGQKLEVGVGESANDNITILYPEIDAKDNDSIYKDFEETETD